MLSKVKLKLVNQNCVLRRDGALNIYDLRILWRRKTRSNKSRKPSSDCRSLQLWWAHIHILCKEEPDQENHFTVVQPSSIFSCPPALSTSALVSFHIDQLVNLLSLKTSFILLWAEMQISSFLCRRCCFLMIYCIK